MRFGIVLLAVILSTSLFTRCSRDNNYQIEQLKKISIGNIKKYLHPDYFKEIKFDAHLAIERKDENGLHHYTGALTVDRGGISRLIIHQKAQYVMTLTNTRATIAAGDAKPMELDLTNPAHNIVLFREPVVLECNPFRYLNRFYDYFMDTTENDTILVIVKQKTRDKRVGDIKIFILKETGLVSEIFFYATSGDLGRRVQYLNPARLENLLIPTEIIIDFVAESSVVRERYRLENIRIY